MFYIYFSYNYMTQKTNVDSESHIDTHTPLQFTPAAIQILPLSICVKMQKIWEILR